MAVVTVRSLGGEDVARFTIALAGRWGVGRRGVNDGVVVLIAPRERKVRISVGDGLRVVLPDSFCRTVIDRRMAPVLARGDYDAGVEAGVSVLIARLRARRSSTG